MLGARPRARALRLTRLPCARARRYATRPALPAGVPPGCLGGGRVRVAAGLPPGRRHERRPRRRHPGSPPTARTIAPTTHTADAAGPGVAPPGLLRRRPPAPGGCVARVNTLRVSRRSAVFRRYCVRGGGPRRPRRRPRAPMEFRGPAYYRLSAPRCASACDPRPDGPAAGPHGGAGPGRERGRTDGPDALGHEQAGEAPRAGPG